MLPSLWPGDVVEVSACTVEDVFPGEIVLALRDGRFFLHRFASRSGSGSFLLRGDSMPTVDPEFPAEALIGRKICSAPLRPWSRAIGIVFSYCGPVRRLALRLHAAQRRVNENSQSAFTRIPELTDAGA